MFTTDEIASVCHAANQALQVVFNDPTIPVSPDWDDLDEETQRSAVNGVQAILDNPDLTPEQSHENWMQFKLDNGWKHGPVKDEQTKEHPLLVPFGQLGAKDRAKDVLFASVVRALADS